MINKNKELRFSLSDSNHGAHAILDELAKVDEIFRHPISKQTSLQGIMADIVPDFSFVRSIVRKDGVIRHVFKTHKGVTFFISEKNRNVWIDVSNLAEGSGGNAIYAAVGNYTYNNKKIFIGDPKGLTEAAVIRRSNLMLSLALRFGNIDFLGSSKEQAKGNPDKGIKPLNWKGNYIDKVSSLIDTVTSTLYDNISILKDCKYDFDNERYEDKQGHELDINWARFLARTEDARALRAGEATLRRGVFLKSIASSTRSERSRLLEKIRDNGALEFVDRGNLRELFSQTDQPITGHYEKSTLTTALRLTLDRAYGVGWFDRLLSTDKFKVIDRVEARLIGREKGHLAARAQGFYSTSRDTTYFVANNISYEDNLLQLALHEIGVHALQLGKNDEEFNAILAHLEELRKTNQQVQDAFALVPATTAPGRVREEVAAYLCQHNPDLPVVKRIASWFRSALRKIGKALPATKKVGLIKWANNLSVLDIVYMANHALKSAPDALIFGSKRDVDDKIITSEKAPRFYSQLRKAFRDAPDKVFGNPQQIKSWLSSNASKLGVKRDEIYWNGINDWLDIQSGKISKTDVLNFLDKNGVTVEDIVLGGTVVAEWEAAASAVNQAIRDRLPDNEIDRLRDIRDDLRDRQDEEGETKHVNYALPGGEDYRELVITIPTIEKYGEADTAHFGDVGGGKQIAWLRMNIRYTVDGEKVLFAEEIQSKRGSNGRKDGFKSIRVKELPQGFEVREKGSNEYAVFDHDGLMVYGTKKTTKEEAKIEGIKRLVTNILADTKIPPAPFITDSNNKASQAYIALILKKAISLAIDNNCSSVAWTTGSQQADRFDLSKNADYVMWDEKYRELRVLKDGEIVISNDNVTADNLDQYIGKDIAKKLIDMPKPLTGAKTLSKEDIKIDPHWVQTMYGDVNGLNEQGNPSLIMQSANDIARKMGGEVGSVSIKVNNDEGNVAWQQPAIIITPYMRQKILNEGMPLFSMKADVQNKSTKTDPGKPDLSQLKILPSENHECWDSATYKGVRIDYELCFNESYIIIFDIVSRNKGKGESRETLRLLREKFEVIHVQGVVEDSPEAILFWQKMLNEGIVDSAVTTDGLSLKKVALKCHDNTTDKPDDLLFSFAGEKAKTADHIKLLTAQYRIETGGDPEAVRQETGWFNGVADGKWRFEIDDSSTKDLQEIYLVKQGYTDELEYINKNYDPNPWCLKNVLENSPLQQAYPEIFDSRNLNVEIRITPGLKSDEEQGVLFKGDKGLYILKVLAKDLVSAKSILLHEIQHLIQRIESFAIGGMPETSEYEDVLPMINSIRVMREDLGIDAYALQNQIAGGYKLNEDNAKKLKEWERLRDLEDEVRSNRLTPFQAYKRLGGEVEARNTQARLSLNVNQRMVIPISATQDIPDGEIIAIMPNDNEDIFSEMTP